jgi:hypothetical protein
MADFVFPLDVARAFFQSMESERRSLIKIFKGKAAASEEVSPVDETGLEFTAISQIVTTAFFASMATEEGTFCRPGIIWAASPEALDKGRLTSFIQPILMTVDAVRKISALCDFGNSFLLISHQLPLHITGIFRPSIVWNYFGVLSSSTVRVLASRPGLIGVYQGQREHVRYEHGAVANRGPNISSYDVGQIKSVVDSIWLAGDTEHCAQFVWDVIFRIALRLRALDCGGMLAIHGPGEPPHSGVLESRELAPPLPLGAAVRSAFGDIDRVAPHGGPEPTIADYKTAFDAKIASDNLRELEEDVARLASVDGSVVLDARFQVVAFAAKLEAKSDLTVYHVDNSGLPSDGYNLSSKGTRHRAGASFAAGGPGRLALTISHDGAGTVFLQRENRVVAWPFFMPLHTS